MILQAICAQVTDFVENQALLIERNLPEWLKT
jgi:hypothetical protein